MHNYCVARSLALLVLLAFRCDLELTERCAVNAQDQGGLLLLYSSTGNRGGMLSLAEDAKKAGRTNVAFLALFVCGKVRVQYLHGMEALPLLDCTRMCVNMEAFCRRDCAWLCVSMEALRPCDSAWMCVDMEAFLFPLYYCARCV